MYRTLGFSHLNSKFSNPEILTSSNSRCHREVFEPREFANEGEFDDAGRAVALFADDQLRDALRVGGRRALVGVEILAVNEDHDIGILLERARLAQIRKLRTVVRTRLRRA